MFSSNRFVLLQYFVCRGLIGDPAVSAINQGGSAVLSDDCMRSAHRSKDGSTVSTRKLMLDLILVLI